MAGSKFENDPSVINGLSPGNAAASCDIAPPGSRHRLVPVTAHRADDTLRYRGYGKASPMSRDFSKAVYKPLLHHIEEYLQASVSMRAPRQRTYMHRLGSSTTSQRGERKNARHTQQEAHRHALLALGRGCSARSRQGLVDRQDFGCARRRFGVNQELDDQPVAQGQQQ